MIQEEDYKEVEKKILAHKEKGVSQELEKKKVAEQKSQRKLRWKQTYKLKEFKNRSLVV